MAREFKILLGLGAIVVAGGVLLAIYANPNSPTTIDESKLVTASSSVRGNTGSSVTVVEFADFQCPACGVAHPINQRVYDEYKDKVKFVYRHFPLSTHRNAPVAAEAAEAAKAQGKFWEMHDKLFETQKEWSDLADPRDKFAEYAGSLGLNVETFKADVQANKYARLISQDYADGESVRVNATPTYYINGKKFAGVLPYDQFVDEIGKVIEK